MTFRIYDPIEESVEQGFEFSLDKHYVVKGFYPYLYMKRAPAGRYVFQLYSNDSLVFEKDFNSIDIKNSLSTNEDTAYVFFPILPDPYLILGKGKFRVKIINETGSFSENAHLGWIKVHRFPVNDINYVPAGDSYLPFAMKIKTLESE